MAQTLTGNNPRREQRIQQILLERISLKYQRRIAREIARAMNEAARILDNPNVSKSILPEHNRRMARILNALWRESGLEMSEHIAGQEKAIASYQRKNEGEQIPSTIIANLTMNSWIARYGSSKITEITGTTQKQINYIISQGINEGLSERETAKRIRELSPIRSAARAQRIARTETHSAANVSAHETAKAAGVEMKREWVAAKNERTRKNHRDANGQVVGMDEPFIVGGFELMYPSDYGSDAPPSETINCRCAVAYVLE